MARALVMVLVMAALIPALPSGGAVSDCVKTASGGGGGTPVYVTDDGRGVGVSAGGNGAEVHAKGDCMGPPRDVDCRYSEDPVIRVVCDLVFDGPEGPHIILLP